MATDDKLQAGFIEGLGDGALEMESLDLTVIPNPPLHKWQGLWDALKRMRTLSKLHLAVPVIEELDEADVCERPAWPALSSLCIVKKFGR